ncbi:MAG: anti-sigma factor [Frankiaceae bacterium]|nr:anti-sigma factor [Frankiaceae bacterium]MBV9872106.1 anti-sigma factor [Frankiaceae bacterium]
MTEHEYWDELAAGHALHALTGEEESTFLDHLSTCAECAASVSDHEMVAAQLGSIAHYREPEAATPSWESMRAAIVGDRSAEITDLGERRRRRHELSRRSLSAAAAAVVLAGGGVVAWQLSSSGGTSCVASQGCHVVELQAAGGKTAASLTVRNSIVTMDASSMSAAPIGKVYVLWQQPRDGRAKPIKEFTAASGATVAASLTTPYSDTQQFAVSLETVGPPPLAPSNLLASGVA